MTNEIDMQQRGMAIGFWLRLLADFLDAIFLGLLGLLIAWPFQGVFFRLGEQGWWIGLVITFLYTGILHTAVGNGQTLAKKLLKIQVIKTDGTFLTLPESFLRYAVIAFIAYNGWIGAGLTATFPYVMNTRIAGILYFLLVLFCVAGVIFLVPLHPFKQGLHDLLVGSVVVRKGSFFPEKLEAFRNPRKARRAMFIATFGFLCLTGIAFSFQSIIAKAIPSSQMEHLMNSRESIMGSTLFQNVGVNINTWHEAQTGKTTTSIRADGFLPKPKYDDKKFLQSEVDKVVKIVIEKFPDIKKYSSIDVVPRTGFNIGIANVNFNQGFRFSADGKELAHGS